MFTTPTLDKIARVAERYGVHLDEEDARFYRDFVVEQLDMLDAFVQERLEEDRPPLLFPERAPGHRPTPAEDPYDAWFWKCRIGGGDEGVLAGKTVAYKDHIAVAGIPVNFGAYELDGTIPDFDATVATRVLAAGGTIVGKNTHHGFAGLRGLGGYLGDYWDAVNPHAADRQPGGSSSGSGVAVAAGEVDISFGGDQGGSIRIPASWCGVVGLMPTFGLVSHMGSTYGGEPTIDHIGPMARSVEDVAAALQAVAGYDGFDPRQGRDVPDAIDALSGLREGVAGLRIGILEEGFDDPLEPEIRDGVLEAAEVLRRAGATVSRISVPEHRTVGAAMGVLQFNGYRATRGAGAFGYGAKGYYPTSLIRPLERLWQRADKLAPYIKLAYVMGELAREDHYGAVYAKAHNVRGPFTRAYDRALTEVDALLTPTMTSVAPPVPEPAPPRERFRKEVEMLSGAFPGFRNVYPFGYTGHPAISVPCGKADGLPFGMQLVGRAFEDPLLLRIAHAFQESVDWEALMALDAAPART